jgi:hypothetical protein
MSKKKSKKSALSKGQNEMLRIPLKRLLGDGLIKGPHLEKRAFRRDVLESALNLFILK